MTKIQIALVVLAGFVLSAGVRADEPIVELQTGLPFPESLGPLKRDGELHKYDSRAMGIGIRYNAPNRTKADIYLYSGGLKALGTGQLNEAVRAHLEECKGNLPAMEKRGNYRAVTHLGDEEITLRAGAHRLPMLDAKYTYSETADNTDLRRQSHILLTTYKGMLLKVRFTYLADNAEEGATAKQALLADLGRVLAKHWDAQPPAKPVVWIKIANPAKNAAKISYTLDGNTFAIAAGESQQLDFQYVLEFDQGTGKGKTSRTLNEDGVYRFTRHDDGSWTLEHGEK